MDADGCNVTYRHVSRLKPPRRKLQHSNFRSPGHRAAESDAFGIFVAH